MTHVLRIGAPLLLSAIPLIALSGCRSDDGGPSSSPQSAALAPAGEANTALERIRIAAQAEKRTAPPTDLAAPPGIDAATLERRDHDDQRARWSLQQVAKKLGIGAESIEPAPRPFINADDAAEAELRYIEGRQYFLDGDYFEAVKSLEQARRLDPGSSSILRLLAQSHVATSADPRARDVYERLLELEPHDAEALVRVGMSYIEREQWAEALPYLLRAVIQSNDESAHDDGGGDGAANDSSAEIVDGEPIAGRLIAAHQLGLALSRHGYDSAAIDAWMIAGELPRRPPVAAGFERELQALYREQGELWQSIGDAWMRLGRFDEARRAYVRASEHPLLRPEALLARLVYADLMRGRTWSAMNTLLEQAEAGDLSAETLALMSYVSRLPGAEHLAEALGDLASERPDSLFLAKAAATLTPDAEGARPLLQYLETHPDDEHAAFDVLNWFVSRGEHYRAIALIIEQAEKLQRSPTAMVNELRALVDDPAVLITAMEEQVPASTARSVYGAIVSAGFMRVAGRDDQALAILDAAAAAHPDSIPIQLNQIEWLTRNDLVGAAEESLDRLLARGPLERAAWVYRSADVLVRLDRGDDALALIDDLEQRAEAAALPDFGARELRRERIESLLILGRVSAATERLAEAIAVDETDEWAHATLLRLSGHNAAAENEDRYKSIAMSLARIAPESAAFRLFRAEQEASFGSVARAIGELKSLAVEYPRDNRTLATLVGAFIKAEQAAEGVRWMNERLEARPGDPLLRDSIVELLIADRRTDEAIGRLQTELLARPGDDAVSLRLEQTLRRTGRGAEAIDIARQRLNLRPDSPRRDVQLALLAIEAGDADEAMRLLERAYAAAKQDKLHLHIAALHAAATALAGVDPDPDRALAFSIQMFDQASADNVELSPAMRLERLIALARAGRPLDEIEAAYRSAVAAEPDEARAYLRQARITLEAAGRTTDAVTLADTALRNMGDLEREDIELILWRLNHATSEGDAQTVIKLGRRLDESGLMTVPGAEAAESGKQIAEMLYVISIDFHAAGHESASELILEESLRFDPDHPMANNNLGYALVDRGERLGEAESMLLKAAKLEAAENNGEVGYNVLDSLGWLRYKQGRLDDQGARVEDLGAISLLERASEAPDGGRQNPVIWDHLGDAYWRAGRADDAKRAWRETRTAYEQQLIITSDELRPLIEETYGEVVTAAEAKAAAADAGEAPNIATSPGAGEDNPPENAAATDDDAAAITATTRGGASSRSDSSTAAPIDDGPGAQRRQQ